MYTAKLKREQNIAEYILYIWQLEDLLRALKFDANSINAALVSSVELESEQKVELLEWYVDICTLLKSEGKSEHGHIDHTLHLINELYELHLLMLKSDAGKQYTALYLDLAPHLDELAAKVKEGFSNPIELCFKALYGVMLQKIKNKGKFDSDVIELISPVVAMLSYLYLKVESGEIDPYKSEQ